MTFLDPPASDFEATSTPTDFNSYVDSFAAYCATGALSSAKALATRWKSDDSLVPSDGFNPTYGLRPAAVAGQIGVLEYLLNEENAPITFSDVATTIAAGREASLAVFAAHGYDFSTAIERRKCLLSFATSPDVATWLVEHGVSPTQHDPLATAAASGRHAVVQRLLELGADVHRSSAPQRAAACDDVRMLETLCGATPDPNLLDSVELAWLRSQDEAAYMRASRHSGDLGTALHCAAEQGNGAALLWLLTLGANKNVLSAQGRTAEEWAMDREGLEGSEEERAECRDLLSHF